MPGGDETVTVQTVDAEVGVLVVVEGPDAGTEMAVDDAPLVVGTSPRAQLHLSDEAVSRMHCELAREGRALRVTDLSSKNGVWLSGARIDSALLYPGTRFRVGGTDMEVRVERRSTKTRRWTGPDRYGQQLVGASRAMHALFAELEVVAPAQINLLLQGESGTGKELVARALHGRSTRRDGPYVVVDCAALSVSLADSELFGHAAGAYTGAQRERAGAFERANGGTIFLDEVAELPLDIQSKLLRVVQEGRARRLGEGDERDADVRVVSATHRDLRRAVNEGSFREDLFYRLAGSVVWVPPLRERGRDAELLAARFARQLAPDDPAAERIATQALEQVAGYRWPGNVRELRAFTHRALMLGDARIGSPTLRLPGPARIRVDKPFAQARRDWVEAFEREYIAHALDQADGNVTEAARRTGLARSSFYELIAKLGL